MPSGRSAASTGQMVPSPVWSPQIRIRWEASWVAARRAAGSSAPSHRLGHEDHVHVADVVELVAAALAHRDDRQPGRGRRRADPLPGHGQRGVEGAGSEVGELGGGVVDGEVVGEVAGGQAQQQAAVLHPQRVDRRGVGQGRRSGVGSSGSAPTARSRPARTAYAAGPGRAEGRVGELAPVLGVPDEVVAQRLAGAEHARAAASRCPRRSTSAASSAVRSGVSVSRTSPASAWSGSAVRPRNASSGSAAGPSVASVGLGPVDVAEAEAQQGSAPHRLVAAHRRVRRHQVERTGRPAVARRCPARRGPHRSRRAAAAGRRRARGGRPGRPRPTTPATGTSTSGCNCTPQARGANRTAWTSPAGVAASTAAPGRRHRDDVVVPVHAASRRSLAQRAGEAGRPGGLGPADVEEHRAAARAGWRRPRRPAPRPAAGGPGRCRAWAGPGRPRRAGGPCTGRSRHARRRRRRPSRRRARPARRTPRGRAAPHRGTDGTRRGRRPHRSASGRGAPAGTPARARRRAASTSAPAQPTARNLRRGGAPRGPCAAPGSAGRCRRRSPRCPGCCSAAAGSRAA